MAGKLTALILAILVANPFCCCFAETAAGDEAHACCRPASQPNPPEPGGADSESEPCDCAHDPADPQILDGKLKPGATEWKLIKEVRFQIDGRAEWPQRPHLHSIAGGWEAAKPPGEGLMQVHCRYLL
jgi:hypothetical protein